MFFVISVLYLFLLQMGYMKEEFLRIRVSKSLKESIYRTAQSKGMNISEYIRYITRKEIERDEQRKR